METRILKSQGVRVLDYMLISHGDGDHIGYEYRGTQRLARRTHWNGDCGGRR